MVKVQINGTNETDIIGKCLAFDVFSEAGHYLLGKGISLTPWHIRILKNHKIQSVDLLETNTEPLNVQIKSVFKKKENISNMYYENVMEIKSLFLQAISNQVPTIQTFMKSFTPLLEEVIEGNNIFLELNHIKGYDEYTYRHSINVGLLAATIGKILRLPQETSTLLGKIGLFHDIGKMKVPQQILNKKGPLTDKEYEEIKKHTIYGKEILEKIEGDSMVLQYGALYHHERLNGSGYPYGLNDANIPFLSQIIAVADTYDAITSDRVYRDKLGPFQALDELVKEVYRGRLHGKIVLPFVEHIIRGFIGNEVKLSDGRKGNILQINIDEIYRPLLIVDDKFVDLRKVRDVSIITVMP